MKFPFCLLLCAAAIAAPLAAGAQSAPPPAGTYVAPQLVKRGTNETALAGPGNVTLQVFVKKDGSIGTIKVQKSSNAGDNAAATEIAKSSTFKSAVRNGKKVDAYFTYALAFAGETSGIGTGPIPSALAAIRAAKYDEAKATLQTYLQAHPGDAQANMLLGVADTFGGDSAGAAAAFSQAGPIPDQYKTLAIQSYEKAATADYDQKKYSDAIAAATSAIALSPDSLQSYYERGLAYSATQNDAAAIADLQKARSIATAAKLDDKSLANISFNLAVVQLDAGQYGEAATTARDVARVDTALSARLNKTVYDDVMGAAAPLVNQGKIADAVSRIESGAGAFPSQAGPLTAQAAYALAHDKKPDWKKVQAEAQKAVDLDGNSGWGYYVLGIALANQNQQKDALSYMNHAKATPDYASSPSLAKQIDAALKQLDPDKAQAPPN